mmetsp:Transcript_7365/g.11228  ORF Transcript_7365/g.11228 Transcript_7365/m.11228 type:complete len:81 (-) Transcript_7365:27-269(-)
MGHHPAAKYRATCLPFTCSLMSSIEAPVPSDLLRLGRADRDEVILVLDAQRVNGEEWRVLMRKAKQAAGTIMPIELSVGY